MPKPEGSSTQQNVAMILAVFVEAANFFSKFRSNDDGKLSEIWR